MVSIVELARQVKAQEKEAALREQAVAIVKKASLKKEAFRGVLAKLFGRGAAKAAPKMGLARKLLIIGGAGTAGAAGIAGTAAIAPEAFKPVGSAIEQVPEAYGAAKSNVAQALKNIGIQ